MEEVKLSEGRHSKLGASGSKRWMNCSGSNALIAALIAEKGEMHVLIQNEEAARGTAAHHVASECLTRDQDAWEWVGKNIIVTDEFSFVVDKEMAEAVQVYLNYVRRRVAQERANGSEVHVFVEKGMQSMLDEEAFGTADTIIICGPNPHRSTMLLIVADYKNGHIAVEPDEPQTGIYAYYAIENFGLPMDTKVERVICQPNEPHPLGPVRVEPCVAGDLVKWFTGEVLTAMNRTRDPAATVTMGEWCRFCPARDACPAVRSGVKSLPLETTPDALTDEELGRLLAQRRTIEAFFESLGKEGLKRAAAGRDVWGHKLVNKLSPRVFQAQLTATDPQTGKPVLGEDGKPKVDRIEEVADVIFGDIAFEPRKLKSPAQLEKVDHPATKAFVQRWAYTPANGYSIAPLSDKRQAVRPAMLAHADQVAAERKASKEEAVKALRGA